MTDVPQQKYPAPWLALFAAAAALFVLDSCSSTPKIQGLPDKLPDIALNGSSATPPHNLPGYEYPFDPSGHYMSDWAADGERRAGRSASATSDDEKMWSHSHRGHVTASTRKKSSTKSSATKKGSGKSSKKKASAADDDRPKSKAKSKTGSGSKSSKKSSGTSKVSSTTKKSGSTPSKKKSSHSDDDKPKKKPVKKSSKTHKSDQ